MSIKVGDRVMVDLTLDPEYGAWLVSGPGVILEVWDLADGVRVLQENEPQDSEGTGWWIETSMVSVIEGSTESD